MTRIGLLSDTHGCWDDRYLEYFAPCQEIWHAGDIGSPLLAERLAAFRTFRAVCGNIDGYDIRRLYQPLLRFRCEEADVLMTHIGGYPGHYDRRVAQLLAANPPHLFISGHSHILKVAYDKHYQLLHINPGAAGRQGWQTRRTLVRFDVDSSAFKNLEVIELG